MGWGWGEACPEGREEEHMETGLVLCSACVLGVKEVPKGARPGCYPGDQSEYSNGFHLFRWTQESLHPCVSHPGCLKLSPILGERNGGGVQGRDLQQMGRATEKSMEAWEGPRGVKRPRLPEAHAGTGACFFLIGHGLGDSVAAESVGPSTRSVPGSQGLLHLSCVCQMVSCELVFDEFRA